MSCELSYQSEYIDTPERPWSIVIIKIFEYDIIRIKNLIKQTL